MFARLILALATLCCAVAGAPSVDAAAAVPPDDGAMAHALNRLTYGPRPGDLDEVRALGLDKWIDRQLSAERIDNNALEARLARLDTLGLSSHTIVKDYSAPAMEERRERKRAAGADADPQEMMKSPVSEAIRKDRQVLTDLEEAKLLRATYSERQLEEVLVDFWFNHFNVFAGKGPTRDYVNDYERQAIRPYVFGKFRDMLGATAKHPAMLFYLDNWQSSAPAGSPTAMGAMGATGVRLPGARRARVAPLAPPARANGGINENYARELLELHTLGVDGGYTQQDIVNVARAFTGWTMRPRDGSGFLFAAGRHDRGQKTVLGHTLPAGGGIEDGERVLDIVAAHPSTAKHIARLLAVKFVSDQPPAGLVDRAAAVFTSTKGDLRAVVRSLITSPEFFDAGARRAKVKTPLEFVVSALRATGAEVRTAVPLARTLRDMGMPLYFCQPPTGYDEVAATWVSAGALVNRMNFAVDLSKNLVRGIRVPLSEEETLALKIGAPEFQRQ